MRKNPKLSIEKSNFIFFYSSCIIWDINQSLIEDSDDLIIKDLFIRFARYEGFKFINLLIEVKDEEKIDVLEVIFENINKAAPPSLIVKDRRFNGNDEILKYPQMVKIYHKDEKEIDKIYTKKVISEDPEVTKYYKYMYCDRKNGIYYRKLDIIYLVEDLDFVNHKDIQMVVHSENLLFRRSNEYNKEVIKITDNLDFLQSSLGFLNQVWPRIRTYFFIAPKFTLKFNKNSIKNKLFLNILETVAQLEIMINRMDYDVKNIKTSYENKFERVRFNIEKRNLVKELEFFDEILEKVKNYPMTLTENINNNSTFLDKLYSQVSHLREDIDSYGNIIMQWLMSMLSIILILWGSFEIFIDKSIKDIIYELPLMALPISLTILLSVFYILSMIFIRSFKYYSIKKTDKNINKWLKENVKEHNLENIKEKYFKKIKNNKTSDIKDILYMVEFYNYLVLALQFDKIDNEKASEYLDELLRLHNKSD